MARTQSSSKARQAPADMAWEVLETRFCLIGLDREPAGEDLALLDDGPCQLVREGGETTLLVAEERLGAVLLRHPTARVERGLAWVRFRTSMDWEVVGFLARVTSALAAADVPLGAVCGFSRDHLFLAETHLPRARGVLEGLFGPPAGDR